MPTHSFKNPKAEDWLIPVDPKNRSFPIRMRAGASDFKRLSFYQAVNASFDPKDVQDKIVLAGISSALLGDIHNTSLGPLPGIFLKANSFLTLYSHDLLKNIRPEIESYFLILGLLLITLSFFFLSGWKRALTAGLIVLIFFVTSYIFLSQGYIWGYLVFPISIVSAYLLLSATQRLFKFPAQ